MNLSNHPNLAATRTDRVIRRLSLYPNRPRLLSATMLAALAAAPRFAHAASGGEAHISAVVIAFSVLVAAAIVTSIATALRRGNVPAGLADHDYSDASYVRDPRVTQYPDC